MRKKCPYKCAVQATCFLLLWKQISPRCKDNRKGLKKNMSVIIYGTVVTPLPGLLKSLMDFIHAYGILKRKLNHFNINFSFSWYYIYHEHLFILLGFCTGKCWKDFILLHIPFLQWHTSIHAWHFLANICVQNHKLVAM